MTETDFIAAWERRERAEAAFVDLALSIGRGAVSRDFPAGDPDARILAIKHELAVARYEADAAVCGYMLGRTYHPHPSLPAQAVLMQERVTRNERDLPRVPRITPDANLPAVGSFGGLA